MEIVLALGGGGAKGAAHLGVLEVLESQGFEIKALAGTSAGGLVGAAYLSGVSLGEIKTAFEDMSLTKLYGRKKDAEPSLLGLAGLTEILVSMIGERTFADLPVPFATTAVDIDTGEVVVFTEGPLLDAVLATIAVPGVFPARRWNGRLLVDGGVLCPVPISPARDLRPDLPLVAVALNQLSKPGKAFSIPETAGSNPVVEYISKLRLAQALNIFIRSTEHSSILLTELLLKLEKPDVVILPDMSGIGMLDEIDVEEISSLGAAAALEKLDELRAVGHPARQAVRWVKRKLGAGNA